MHRRLYLTCDNGSGTWVQVSRPFLGPHVAFRYMLMRLLCGLLASGGTMYEQVLVGEKLKSGNRGVKTEMTGRSP